VRGQQIVARGVLDPHELVRALALRGTVMPIHFMPTGDASAGRRFNLPAAYPSVAPNYSAARSAMAKSLGLGQGGRGAKGKPAVPAPKTRAKKTT
jgi:hypothetical protein